MLRRLAWSSMTVDERDWIARRGTAAETTDELRPSIDALVEDVRTRGDQAVCDALARFDGVELDPDQLRVTGDEIERATSTVEPELRRAIGHMIANIRRFNEELRARRQSWTAEIFPGHTVGERVGPVASAALFCPSGKASYPSVLAQIATPAVVAGVPQLTVIVPPVPGAGGEIDPAVLIVAHQLELTNVFRVNGPAGVAAAAFGTQSIPAHGMVVGPGSPAVALAQLAVRAHGVDSVVLGPTESMVVADATAHPHLVAADLLNEAEHGTDSTVLLVTDDSALVDAVDRELDRQVGELPASRREAAASALGRNGGAIVVDTLDQAPDVANWFAPEHCQLATADPWSLADRVQHAGELLLGQQTPFAVGNFTLGGPAALPTGGHANRAGGITVETFLKASAVGHLTGRALDAVADSTIALADHEGFPAHANALHHRRS